MAHPGRTTEAGFRTLPVRPEPGLFLVRTPPGTLGSVADEELLCRHCGRTGSAADLAAGWVVSRPPRPVGRSGPRGPDEERTTALCPDRARRHLRDLEARLDP